MCAYARTLGWIAKKFKSPGTRAEPDRILFRRGVTIFIEFKRPGKRPTKAQFKKLKEYREAGFEAVWFDDYGKAKEYLSAQDEQDTGPLVERTNR